MTPTHSTCRHCGEAITYSTVLYRGYYHSASGLIACSVTVAEPELTHLTDQGPMASASSVQEMNDPYAPDAGAVCGEGEGG